MKKKTIKQKIKKLKKAKKKLEKKLKAKVSKKTKKLSKKKVKNKKVTAKKVKNKPSAKKAAKKSKKAKLSDFSKDVKDLGEQVFSTAEELGNRAAAKAEEFSNKIADDLKKIKGIGPVFEKRLIDLGIKTFEDMANLSQEIIDDVAEKIKAKPERIVKEHWKEQAEELLKDDKKED